MRRLLEIGTMSSTHKNLAVVSFAKASAGWRRDGWFDCSNAYRPMLLVGRVEFLVVPDFVAILFALTVILMIDVFRG
jgi:hypothetical protein